MIATKILPIINEENVFFQMGRYWVVKYKGKPTTLRDRKGLQYIGYLLKHPGEQFWVVELTSVFEKNQPDTISEEYRRMNAEELERCGMSVRKDLDGPRTKLNQAVIDKYKEQYKDLECQLEEATKNNDQGNVEKIQNWIRMIKEEIFKRPDIDNTVTKKAYLNIKNHIGRALKDIGNDPNISPLKKYLQRYIKTGFSCSYNPDPDHTISFHIFTNA